MSKTAAEANVECIEKIVAAHIHLGVTPIYIARKIVEAFPELQRSLQYTSEGNHVSHMVITPLPWAKK